MGGFGGPEKGLWFGMKTSKRRTWPVKLLSKPKDFACVLLSKPRSSGRKMKRRRDAGWTGRDVQEEDDEMMLYSWKTGSPGR